MRTTSENGISEELRIDAMIQSAKQWLSLLFRGDESPEISQEMERCIRGNRFLEELLERMEISDLPSYLLNRESDFFREQANDVLESFAKRQQRSRKGVGYRGDQDRDAAA